MKKTLILILILTAMFSLGVICFADLSVSLSASSDLGTSSISDYKIISNGAGGALIIWQSSAQVQTSAGSIFTSPTYATHYYLNCLKVNSDGTVSGSTVSNDLGTSSISNFNILSNGVGGALIIWQSSAQVQTSAGSIFTSPTYETHYYLDCLQVNSSGTVLGSTVSNDLGTSSSISDFKIISNGMNGALVIWQSSAQVQTSAGSIFTSPTYETHYYLDCLQVNSSGTVLGSTVSNDLGTSSSINNFNIISNGIGGALIVWQSSAQVQTSAGSIFTSPTYATHYYLDCLKVNSDGTVSGSTVSNDLGTSSSISDFNIVSDGIGGALIIWQSSAQVQTSAGSIFTSPTYATHYYLDCLKVNSSGTVSGSTVSNDLGTSSSLSNFNILSNGVGGALIIWQSSAQVQTSAGSIFTSPTYATHYYLNCLKVDSSGTASGSISSNDLGTSSISDYNIVSNGLNGALIIWQSSGQVQTSAGSIFTSPTYATHYYLDCLQLSEYLSTVYASPSGHDDYGDGSINFPYATIQQALTKVATGGVVSLAAGIYQGPGNRSITWPGKNNVQLIGSGPSTTIVSADSVDRIINIGGSVSATFEGIAFSNANGGAIVSGTTGTVNVINCAFTNNNAADGQLGLLGLGVFGAGNGGALSLNSPAYIYNTVFMNNRAGNGYSGVNSSGLFTSGNSGGLGGAIYSGSTVNLINCLFSGNNAGYGTSNAAGGSGGAVYAASGNITNCDFYDNSARQLRQYKCDGVWRRIVFLRDGVGHQELHPLAE